MKRQILSFGLSLSLNNWHIFCPLYKISEKLKKTEVEFALYHYKN